MAGIAGRDCIVKRSGVVVAGVRVKGLSIAGSSIDTTNDDDAAVRTLLDVPGQVDVGITVSGILTPTNALLAESLSTADRVAATVFEIGTGSPTQSFSGDFFLASFNIGAEYQGAATFDAEFQSAGTVSYSAG